MEEITYSQMKIEDREQVLDFLRLAYPDTPRQSDPRFWTWHYVDHPNTRKGEIPIWLAKSGDRLLGQLATIPVKLRVAGEDHEAVWILDLMVDPEFRRRGIMKQLVREANKQYEYMLGSATRKQHSAAMLTSMGWSVFSPIPRFHKILFPGSALREAANVAPVRALMDAAYAPFRPRRRGVATDPNIQLLTTIDSNFDKLWAECRDQWGCSIERSSDYLKWQFEDQPGKEFELVGYVDDGRLMGYAVIFFRKPSAAGVIGKAAISDLCYHPSKPEHIIDKLVAAAIDLAVERRAGGLVTDAIDPLVEDRLRSEGFRPVTSGLEVMAFGPDHHAQLYNANAWHLTRGDSDISIFEEPNLDE